MRAAHYACAPIVRSDTQAHVHTRDGGSNVSVNSDLRKAKEMRANAKTVQDVDAKEAFIAAAARLEKRAAKNAKKVGRIRRRTASGSAQVRR